MFLSASGLPAHLDNLYLATHRLDGFGGADGAGGLTLVGCGGLALLFCWPLGRLTCGIGVGALLDIEFTTSLERIRPTGLSKRLSPVSPLQAVFQFHHLLASLDLESQTALG